MLENLLKKCFDEDNAIIDNSSDDIKTAVLSHIKTNTNIEEDIPMKKHFTIKPLLIAAAITTTGMTTFASASTATNGTFINDISKAQYIADVNIETEDKMSKSPIEKNNAATESAALNEEAEKNSKAADINEFEEDWYMYRDLPNMSHEESVSLTIKGIIASDENKYVTVLSKDQVPEDYRNYVEENDLITEHVEVLNDDGSFYCEYWVFRR